MTMNGVLGISSVGLLSTSGTKKIGRSIMTVEEAINILLMLDPKAIVRRPSEYPLDPGADQNKDVDYISEISGGDAETGEVYPTYVVFD